VLALLLVAGVVGFAVYYQWMYRTRLNQVIEPVRAVARLEAQAVAANDQYRSWRCKTRTMPHGAWRRGTALASWNASAYPCSAGRPSARNVAGEYLVAAGRRAVGCDVSVFGDATAAGWAGDRHTASAPVLQGSCVGWVRARPGADYWGPWRTLSGQLFAMRYTQRDASVLEGLIPRMDEVLGRVCGQLPCPPQPIYMAFENAPDSLDHLSDMAFESDGFSLSFVSPHLIGLPADARSRDELYRVIGTRAVQALVYEASGRHLNMQYWASQEIMRWELTRAGLAGPFITPASHAHSPCCYELAWHNRCAHSRFNQSQSGWQPRRERR